MLRGIVTDVVEGQSDMEIVGNFAERAQLFQALATPGIDVAIIGVQQSDDLPLAQRIFDVSPLVRLLLVTITGRSAVMYQLRPHRVRLGEASPQGLIAAIRGHGRRDTRCDAH